MHVEGLGCLQVVEVFIVEFAGRASTTYRSGRSLGSNFSAAKTMFASTVVTCTAAGCSLLIPGLAFSVDDYEAIHILGNSTFHAFAGNCSAHNIICTRSSNQYCCRSVVRNQPRFS